MDIIKIYDVEGRSPSVYEVWYLWKMIYTSGSMEECVEYIDKRGFLYDMLLLW